VVPGAGAFQVACAAHLNSDAFSKTVKGKAKWGVQAFADALLIIPKTLAANAGHDVQDARKYFCSFQLCGSDILQLQPSKMSIERVTSLVLT